MGYEEAFRLAVTFLGGGAVFGSIISWMKDARAEQRRRRAERIRVQMERLYGPLYFHSSLNEKLFELVAKIQSAYEAEYSGKNWSLSEGTQAALRIQTDSVIELGNTYSAIARRNCSAMVEILRGNYANIDPEDEDVFIQFVLDQARLEQEFPKEGPMKMPIAVYKQVGDVAYMRPEFASRVREGFMAKKKVLEGLGG